MNAILKHDSPAIPYCVYNEKVATNLAQTMHIPNAAGVLANTPGVHGFASLEIASPKIALPNMRPSWNKKAAEKYPEQASALIIFDILIGNTDRYENLKVSLFTPSVDIFAAFDHSHALLHPWYKTDESIAFLCSDNLISNSHPFFGLIDKNTLYRWCDRVMETPNYLIKECCEFNRPINTVDVKTQEKLGRALIYRKNRLMKIIEKHESTIRWE